MSFYLIKSKYFYVIIFKNSTPEYDSMADIKQTKFLNRF